MSAITYRFPEERDLLRTYARRLGNGDALDIIERGTIDGEADARNLSHFFWNMIDASVGSDDPEYLFESLIISISSACIGAGFREVWDEVVDTQK